MRFWIFHTFFFDLLY